MERNILTGQIALAPVKSVHAGGQKSKPVSKPAKKSTGKIATASPTDEAPAYLAKKLKIKKTKAKKQTDKKLAKRLARKVSRQKARLKAKNATTTATTETTS